MEAPDDNDFILPYERFRFLLSLGVVLGLNAEFFAEWKFATLFEEYLPDLDSEFLSDTEQLLAHERDKLQATGGDIHEAFIHLWTEIRHELRQRGEHPWGKPKIM
jgi:hypothetical protein